MNILFPCTPTDLLQLADRCEREGPSPELDCAIAEAIGGRVMKTARAYGISLDAAVTLVPEKANWVLEIATHCDERAATIYPDYQADEFDKHCAFAKTPALSLCAAALRARAGKPSEVEPHNSKQARDG